MIPLLLASILSFADAPATTAAAAKVIDLVAFPLPAGDVKINQRTLAGIGYRVKGDAPGAYSYVRDKLTGSGWTELPSKSSTPTSASGFFQKSGFTLSVSVYVSSSDGYANVRIMNHGNLDLKSVPVPPGCTPFYELPTVLSRLSTQSPAEAKAALAALLKADGWEPYGDAGETRYYKKNAVLLHARIDSAPAQAGKTFVEYSAEQLSADIPAPPSADRFQYTDLTKRQVYWSKEEPQAIHDFYARRLKDSGWEATTDKPVTDRNRLWRIYRNPEKELIEVDVQSGRGETKVTVKHQTAAELAEEEKRAKEYMAKKEAERNKPLPVVSVKLPDNAQGVKTSKTRIEFTTASGAAKAASEAVRESLRADGWTEKKPVTDTPQFAHVDLTKGTLTLTVSFIDPGFVPGQVTISGFSMDLKVAGK
jgi:hypothetical protein